MSLVIVFAFDPVPELEQKQGLLSCEAELAERLVAEHRVEHTAPHIGEAMRYIAGSPAYEAARDDMRQAAAAWTPPRRSRRETLKG